LILTSDITIYSGNFSVQVWISRLWKTWCHVAEITIPRYYSIFWCFCVHGLPACYWI